jgi:catechol 2,3-dioxygenase-like lactoylglutathione lyase family enzyme
MHPLTQVSQIARRVESLDRARGFWRDTLAIAELYAFPGLAFFDLGQTRLMLRETGTRDEADILYLATPDIAASHSRLTDRGAIFVEAPHLIHRHPDGTEEWMAFFQDDEGRPLALHMRAAHSATSG